MTDYISTPISVLNDDLNTVQTQLSAKADKSEITAFITEDALSDYATETYVQEYVAEHGGGSGDISACLSSAEFATESYLSTNAFGDLDLEAVSIEDLGNKINKILQLLKRNESVPVGGDPTKTYVKYLDGSIIAINSGTSIRDGGGIQNKENVVAVKIGNTVEYLDYNAFNNFSNMESLVIPDSCIRIGAQLVGGRWYDATGAISNCPKLQNLRIPSTVIRIGQNAFNTSAKTIIFEGKTMEEVQTMDSHDQYPWGGGIKHAQFVCTDGTITL